MIFFKGRGRYINEKSGGTSTKENDQISDL